MERKQNELAVNTKVGQLFLLCLFLRHYFVDSNIRNLQIGYRRVSCIKTIFLPLYFFHITRFHSVTSNPKSFSPAATLDPRPRLWTCDRDIGPATTTLDPRPRLWTRDPRPATISQTHYFPKHGGQTRRQKWPLRSYFSIFYLFELKVCRMVERCIPNSRMLFVFQF